MIALILANLFVRNVYPGQTIFVHLPIGPTDEIRM